jgi:APA family basic amino acid/polyamine antiporter
VPIASIVFSLFVVIGLPTITFVIFGVWIAVWMGFYFMYGIKHSRLGRLREEDPLERQPISWR